MIRSGAATPLAGVDSAVRASNGYCGCPHRAAHPSNRPTRPRTRPGAPIVVRSSPWRPHRPTTSFVRRYAIVITTPFLLLLLPSLALAFKVSVNYYTVMWMKLREWCCERIWFELSQSTGWGTDSHNRSQKFGPIFCTEICLVILLTFLYGDLSSNFVTLENERR